MESVNRIVGGLEGFFYRFPYIVGEEDVDYGRGHLECALDGLPRESEAWKKVGEINFEEADEEGVYLLVETEGHERFHAHDMGEIVRDIDEFLRKWKPKMVSKRETLLLAMSRDDAEALDVLPSWLRVR